LEEEMDIWTIVLLALAVLMFGGSKGDVSFEDEEDFWENAGSPSWKAGQFEDDE
jgi:hypothetical protein